MTTPWHAASKLDTYSDNLQLDGIFFAIKLFWLTLAKLANRLLLTPQVRCSNPVIGKVLLNIVNCQLY